MSCWALFAAHGGVGVSIASEPIASDFTVREIAEGVFVHRGAHAGLDDPARSDSANIGFVIGKKCVAVIDTGGSVATGNALRDAIRQHSALPVCYVINTHVHFDHVLGNAAFRDDGARFVGHRVLVDAMAANHEFFAEQFSAELGNLGGDGVIGPSLTVDETLDLDLGERMLTLEAHQIAHTNADLTVFDRRTGTLWTGDLVFRERMPVLDGSLKGWLAWLEKQSLFKPRLIVPGHGPVATDWAQATTALVSYLTNLRDEVRAAIAQGVFLEDATETLSKDAAATWLLNDRHPRNVSRAYREFEWE